MHHERTVLQHKEVMSCHAASKVGQKRDNGLKYLQILLSKRYYFIFMVFNLCKILLIVN